VLIWWILISAALFSVSLVYKFAIVADVFQEGSKGCEARTRNISPKLKPDIVKAPERKDKCERCGSPLGGVELREPPCR